MRINFILNAFDKRCFKRIKEFQEMGYDIKAYAFDRGTIKQTDGIDIEILGQFPNSMPYVKRIKIIYGALKKLFRNTRRNDNDLWYYFGLQMCIFCAFLNKNKKYFFEESDMSHLGIRYGVIRNLLEKWNKRFIERSLLSVFTSEGFLEYHFENKDKYPSNIVIMPNKLDKTVRTLHLPEKKTISNKALHFGFVGFIRYESVYNMAYYIASNFPNHEFHFYGEFSNEYEKSKYEHLKKYPNVFFHGFFKTPEDLPNVYSNINVVVSTYDTKLINVRYAEPNKLYESIYFRVPIVVSERTFLGRQVKKYGCGWMVDANNEKSVCEMVKTVEREIISVTHSMDLIPQEIAIENVNPLKGKMEKLGIL